MPGNADKHAPVLSILCCARRTHVSGQGGYITPAAWVVPTTSDRGGKIESGPQLGKVAT